MVVNNLHQKERLLGRILMFCGSRRSKSPVVLMSKDLQLVDRMNKPEPEPFYRYFNSELRVSE